MAGAGVCCHGYGRLRQPSEEDGSVSSGGSGKLSGSKTSSARRSTTTSGSKIAKEAEGSHKRASNGERL